MLGLVVALRLADQYVQQMVDNAFRGMATARPHSGFGIEINYRSKPFYPQPLPGINEEELIRIRTCASCAVRYAVFGEHRCCPVCGPLSAEVVALDALAAETARLDGLRQLPVEAAALLREQGVFTRLWVDTLENVVGVVEPLARAVFYDAVPNAAARVKGNWNVFQRLDDFADLFVSSGYPDLRLLLDDKVWLRLQATWATRHVFAHNDGVIDDKYIAKVPTSAAKLGQRATVTEPLCRQAVADAHILCTAIASITAEQTPPPA